MNKTTIAVATGLFALSAMTPLAAVANPTPEHGDHHEGDKDDHHEGDKGDHHEGEHGEKGEHGEHHEPAPHA